MILDEFRFTARNVFAGSRGISALSVTEDEDGSFLVTFHGVQNDPAVQADIENGMAILRDRANSVMVDFNIEFEE